MPLDPTLPDRSAHEPPRPSPRPETLPPGLLHPGSPLLLAAACSKPASSAASGEDAGPPPPPPPASAYSDSDAPAPAPDPLDQLLGPVALYPDPLIALLLPAAAFPDDLQAAAAYLNGGGDPAQTGAQPWDDSVRGLAHYPDVLKWMVQNSDWTQALGAAFVNDPKSVMAAIQRLRALAYSAGTLTSTSEEQVLDGPDGIEIEPAQPDVIYVPHYDPEVVYVDQPYTGYAGPYFWFGSPYPAGPWLAYGPDWAGFGIVLVGRDYWHGPGGWWHPRHVDFAGARRWNFPAGRPAPRAAGDWRTSRQVEHPAPMAGAPARPPAAASRDIRTRGPAAASAVARDPGAFKGKTLPPALQQRSAGPAERQPPRREEPSAGPAQREPTLRVEPPVKSAPFPDSTGSQSPRRSLRPILKPTWSARSHSPARPPAPHRPKEPVPRDRNIRRPLPRRRRPQVRRRKIRGRPRNGGRTSKDALAPRQRRQPPPRQPPQPPWKPQPPR